MRLLSSIIVALFFLNGLAMATDPQTKSFTADPKIQTIAEAYAQNAVDFARKQFGIQLDWTDASIANVETALAKMHQSYISTTPRPTEKQVMSFAYAFGSYIGEVYRRNHGGEWGIVDLEGQKYPGIKSKSGTNFWPWGRALNRIIQGPENNVADYYKMLLEKQKP